MRSYLHPSLTLILLGAIGCAHQSPGPPRGDSPGKAGRFVQDRFVIGSWVDPPADERMDDRYGEYAQAHFNVVIGGFGARTVADVERQLALCAKHGLKVLVHCRGVPAEEWPGGPACWGYALRDEPGADDFPDLARQVEAVRMAHPGCLAYINLFPGYANPERQLKAESYDDYVGRFLEQVPVDVLSMDHYPIFRPERDGREAYCADLRVMREHSLRHGIPFWNFFNVMPFGPHTDPTEAQVRWQVFTSVAYGAKGVLYFCYYTPAGDEFPKGGAVINRDDRRTRHWYQARRLNEQLQNLGPTLMQLTSTGVYRIKPGDEPAGVLRGTPIRDIIHAKGDPDFDYLVGVFQHADGRRAVLINNYAYAFTAWPTVEFDAGEGTVVEVDPHSGGEVPILDDSPAMPGLQISLDAGGGRLFLLPAQ